MSAIYFTVIGTGVWKTNVDEQKTLDRVALLIADPPPANSTSMNSRLLRQDRSLYIGGTAYMPCQEKLTYHLNLWCNFKISYNSEWLKVVLHSIFYDYISPLSLRKGT